MRRLVLQRGSVIKWRNAKIGKLERSRSAGWKCRVITRIPYLSRPQHILKHFNYVTINPTISSRIILLVASMYKNSAFLNNDNNPASKLVTLLKAWNSLRKRKKKRWEKCVGPCNLPIISFRRWSQWSPEIIWEIFSMADRLSQNLWRSFATAVWQKRFKNQVEWLA